MFNKKRKKCYYIGYIYIIRNKINSKVYIGQTKYSIKKRWREHLYSATYRNQLLYIAMRKYGTDNFYIEELEKVDESDSLDDREIFYIKKYNSVSPNGYNITIGGSKFKDDNPMYHKKICEKVSKAFQGDKNPTKRPEVKEKIRKKALGKKASKETREKMSKNNGRYWKGKKLPEEVRKKLSENHWCRGLNGGLNPASKKVARIDKDSLKVLQEYDSIKDAIEWIHMNGRPNARASNISQVCHGRQKTAFGYIWKLI